MSNSEINKISCITKNEKTKIINDNISKLIKKTENYENITIGFFGSCQLCTCSDFFINDCVKNDKKIIIKFSLPFFHYDKKFVDYYIGELDYDIFNNLDYLVIENNDLNSSASSKNIIDFCTKRNIKIFKTILLNFPIYPINWSGSGENIKDYENFNGLENIDYICKFNKCINSLKKNIETSDLNISLINYIENNFSEKLLFTHSLHPTNILLFELWKQILAFLNIDTHKYNYNLDGENIINCWYNPFTTKMVKDLKINFSTIIDDDFYLQRYENNKNLLNK